MPKQIYKLNDFSGGLNWNKDPRDIADNELVQADFCYLDRVGGIRGSGVFNPGGQSVPPEGTHTVGGGYYSFESDHVDGSSAVQIGAQWLCTVDGLDGTFEATAIVGSEYTAATTGVDLGAVDAPSWTANQLAFGSGGTTISRNSGAYFDASNIESGDFIQISGCTTDVDRNCYAFVGAAGSTRLQLDGVGISAVTSNEAGAPVIKRLIRPVFFDNNDDVRIADASFSAGTRRKKYSYVKRTHFDGAAGAEDSYDNWFANNCDLTPPTELAITADYPAAGVGFRLTAATPAGGSFLAKTWQIAGSLIYEDDQESLLYIPAANHEITTAADDSIDLDIRATPPFDERVTGARIYIRESGSRDAWSMLVDISLREGVRAKFDSEYTAWTRGGSDTEVYVNTTLILAENFETYSIINGFAPDEFKIDLQATGESYKDAILANRRCFVANVKMLDPEGNGTSDLIRMRDRIMYTPPGKFDTFPRSFFIDVVRGDADEYTALAYYADRLFAFKKNTLYIINISSPSPANWFLESTERNKGVGFPCSVWTAKNGIYWANFTGVFWFNGSDVIDITEGKLPQSSYISGNRMALGYMPLVWYDFEVNSLYIKSNAYSRDDRGGSQTADNRGTWVFNFNSGGWSRLRYDAFGTETLEYYSNIVVRAGTVFYAGSITQQEGDGSLDITSSQGSFEDDLRASNASLVADKQIVKTKDIDFGNPAKIKKVYSVIITYRASAAMTTPVSYATDGGSSYTNFTGNFSDTGAGASTEDWAKLRVTLAAPVECQSLQIKIQNTAQGSFQINDISIEYRMINKRVS
jgi:hypothetical protein